MEPLPEILSNVCALIAQVIMLAPAEQRRALCIHVRQELEAVVVAVSTDEDSEERERVRARRLAHPAKQRRVERNRQQ